MSRDSIMIASARATTMYQYAAPTTHLSQLLYKLFLHAVAIFAV